MGSARKFIALAISANLACGAGVCAAAPAVAEQIRALPSSSLRLPLTSIPETGARLESVRLPEIPPTAALEVPSLPVVEPRAAPEAAPSAPDAALQARLQQIGEGAEAISGPANPGASDAQSGAGTELEHRMTSDGPPAAMRLSEEELTVPQHKEVVNPIIASAFTARKARLIAPGTKDYPVYDPQGTYEASGTKVYVIELTKKEFRLKAKALAARAGVDAPLDLVAHPGRSRNQVYYFAHNSKIVAKLPYADRALIAEHELYHIRNPKKTEQDAQEEAPLPKVPRSIWQGAAVVAADAKEFVTSIPSMMRGDDAVRPFVDKYRGAIRKARALLIFDAVLFIGIGYFTGRVIDAAGGDAIPKALVPYLSFLFLTMFSSFVYSAVELGHTLTTSLTGIRLVKDIRTHLFKHLASLSMGFHHTVKPSELSPRLSEDVTQLEAKNVHVPFTLPYHLLSLLFNSAVLLSTDWRIALMVMASLPLFAVLTTKVSNLFERINERYMNKRAKMIGYAADAFSIMEAVKIFGIEDRVAAHFEESAEELKGIGEKSSRVESWYHVLLSSLGDFSTKLLIVGLCTWTLFRYGHPSVGTILALESYALGYAGSIEGLSEDRTKYKTADGGTQRVLELLAMKPEIADSPDAADLGAVKGRIEFKNVGFSYDGKTPLLDDLSFTIEPGQSAAFVGGTGSGKSTIIRLMARLYDPQRGGVFVDGRDLRDVKRASLTGALAIVPQDGGLFRGSVRANLVAVQPDAGEERLRSAIEAAQARFILDRKTHPQGLDTDVNSLSGGERQRIAIVRALLRDPRILFLDEATSALDNKTERSVKKALEKLMKGRTTVIVAHRLTTVQNVDKIFVLDGGRIAESGTHAELLARKGKYFEMWNAGLKDAAAP
ncbi:MAG: ABC transporter ATP-binding protein [Elusimicrobia bacterium]|nr:ABC transporter ATP-binding protein [Elusimicrobiota bacterium]